MPTRTHMRHQASIFPQTLPPALYDIFLAHPEVQRDAGFEHIDSPPDSLGGLFGPTPQREIRENHRVAVTPYAGEAPGHAQLLTKRNNCKTLDAAFLSGFVERRFNAWPGGTSAIPCRYARGQAAKGEFKTMKVDLLHAEAAGDLSAGVSGKHHVVVTSDMIEELEENTLRGHGTIARRGELIATTCGVVERTNKLICVRPVVQSRYVSPLVAWALSLI